MNKSTTNQEQTFEGPAMSVLHHRLTAAPKSLYDNSVPDAFVAIIHDAVYQKDAHFSYSLLEPFSRNAQQCDWYALSLLIAYFLTDASFTHCTLSHKQLFSVLEKTARELSSAGRNAIYIEDVDRREEFIRVVLSSLGLRPQGETDTQAEDRLQAVSSQERLKVLQASQAAEQRANEIRIALARKKAQEAADKMTRE